MRRRQEAGQRLALGVLRRGLYGGEGAPSTVAQHVERLRGDEEPALGVAVRVVEDEERQLVVGPAHAHSHLCQAGRLREQLDVGEAEERVAEVVDERDALKVAVGGHMRGEV